MAITADEVPTIIVERFEASHPAPAFFAADEIDEWPEGVFPSLIKNKLLRKMPRATTLVCGGCHWNCDKPVVVRKLPSSHAIRAFIVCDEEPDLGRIGVPTERLQRYGLAHEMLQTFITRAIEPLGRGRAPNCNGRSLGLVKGRYGARPIALSMDNGVLKLWVGRQCECLIRLLRWQDGKIELDLKAIRRLANRKQRPSKSSNVFRADRRRQEQRTRRKSSRNQKILQEAKRLRALGMSWTAAAREIEDMDFIKKEQGQVKPISASRVRRIISEMLNR